MLDEYMPDSDPREAAAEQVLDKFKCLVTALERIAGSGPESPSTLREARAQARAALKGAKT